MLAIDEGALICDFAETYHIYDIYAMPIEYVAQLAVGLRENSRIKTRLNNLTIPFDLMMSSLAVDYLALLVWMQSKDGAENQNRPESITAHLLGIKNEKDDDVQGFDSVEEFEKAYKMLLGG